MTKKKVVGKNQKRRNQTAHQRAMTDPKVRKALVVLQSNWKILSDQELGEQLTKLQELNCSARGIADELKKPPTAIHRLLALVKSSRFRSDSAAVMGHTFEKKPGRQSNLSSIEAARESKAMFERSKALRLGTNKTGLAKEPQRAAEIQPAVKAQSAKLAASPALMTASEPSLKSEGLEEKVTPTQEVAPKIDSPNIYQLAQANSSKRIQRLASISDQIAPRPYRDARSMKRQGRPVPEKDRS